MQTQMTIEEAIALPLNELLNRMVRGTSLFETVVSDDMLKMSYHTDSNAHLVVVNASKKLPTPKEAHQLLCKGIVFDYMTCEVVALPLVKTYNWHERIEVQRAVAASGKNPIPLEKLDGTMIQVFRYKGELFFNTRSSFDAESPSGFVYTDEARRLLGNGDEIEEGKSYVFELICPESRVITNYGEQRRLVLISVLDMKTLRYMTHAEMQNEYVTLDVVDAMPITGSVSQVNELIKDLSDSQVSEGVMCCIESEESGVTIRYKIKCDAYIRALKSIRGLSPESIRDLIVAQEECSTKEGCVNFLTASGLPEELIPDAEAIYDVASKWVDEYQESKSRAHRMACEFMESNPGDFKSLALHLSKMDLQGWFKSMVFGFARNNMNDAQMLELYKGKVPCK